MHHRIFKIAGLIFLFAFLPSVSSAQSITFAKVVNIKGGAAPRSIALGDFNRDGKPDVAVANSGSNGAVTVLRGNGNGTFTQTASIPFAKPVFVVAADFDGDGKLDLVVANSTDSNIYFAHGDGAGHFSAPVVISAALDPVSFSHAIAVADLNSDGNLDLVVTNSTNKTLVILLGDGAGAFTLSTMNLDRPAQSVAAADFNGDGKLDLAEADSNTVWILPGNGDGTFATPIDISQNVSPAFVAVGDFNRDGIPDLAVGSGTNKRISIRLGTGDPAFDFSAVSSDMNFEIADIPQFIVVADFNGDGILDLAAAPGGSLFSVLQGKGDGKFDSQNLVVKSGSLSAVAADFTGDGKPDILLANFQTGGFSLLTNTTAFTPGGAFSAPTSFAAGDSPFSVAVADLDRDGILDVVVVNSLSDNISVLLGNGDGTLGTATNFDVGTNPFTVAVGDFNRDGNLDLAVTNSNSNNVSILLGDGTGSFAATTDVPTGAGPWSVAAGDFNRDGKLDILVTNTGDDNVSFFPGNGDGSFGAAINSSTGDEPTYLAVGDFNDDGKLDIAVTNIGSSSVSILLGDGAGSFTNATGSPFGVGTNPISPVVGDFNGDGKLDLAVANLGNSLIDGSVSVFLGAGNGTFSSATDFVSGTHPNGLAVADFNLDGNLDLAVANFQTDNITILTGNGDGSFSNGPGSPFGTGDHPTGITVGDFDADGRPDLASSNQDSDDVSILLNTTPPPTVLAPSTGEIWTIGTTQTIRWTYAGAGGFVNVWLSRDGGATWKTILKKAANDGSQTWKVTGPATVSARVRVCTTAKTPVCDAVGGTFTIN